MRRAHPDIMAKAKGRSAAIAICAIDWQFCKSKKHTRRGLEAEMCLTEEQANRLYDFLDGLSREEVTP